MTACPGDATGKTLLAEHAGLDRSYIAGIEVGARNPSLKALERLAPALSTGLSGLFADDA
jgi:transcriptional regulator with XRE-family HTH domain